MKTILISTDFTVSSLNLVRDAMERSTTDKYQIILAHGCELSSSISELLFFSKAKMLAELENNEFKAAVNVICNSYQSKIARVEVDILYSSNLKYLDHYLKTNNVSKIYLPNAKSLLLPHKRSFNLIPRLRKTSVTYEDLEWQVEPRSQKSENKITDLFFRKM